MKLQIQDLKGDSNSITKMCNKLYLSQPFYSDAYKCNCQAFSCLLLKNKHLQPLLNNYELAEDDTNATH
jgi:hypothetical protein